MSTPEAEGQPTADPHPDAPPVVISMAVQLGPLMKPDGSPFVGNLQHFAESFTHYVATNLEKFADTRLGDSFVAVTLQRGEERAGHQFRSGHYVKDESVTDTCPEET